MKMMKNKTRNGVILLLILALLTLFATLALAFILAAAHQKRLAEHGEKIGTGDTRLNQGVTQSDLDDALKQLLRGAEGTIIGPHSILENLYGNVAEQGTINTAQHWNNGTGLGLTPQELDLLSRPGFDNLTHQLLYVETDQTWNEQQMDFLGNVLTITSGELKDKSTRILGKTLSGRLVIVPIEGMTSPAVINGADFVINGASYSGEGAGYDVSKAASPWDAQLTLPDSDGMLFAERPNVMAPSVTPNPTTGEVREYLNYLDDPTVFGGANQPPVRMNVDYTAPDANNLFLAWYDFATSPFSIIPSFHRPELVARVGASVTEDMLRKVVLRPMQFDHPDFTGSNPLLDTSTASSAQTALSKMVDSDGDGTPDRYALDLDVDNDGDGVKEGIWLDIGLPVRQSAAGTEYKPLVSMTVLDLDGRTNVNVHGNIFQALMPPTLPVGGGMGPAGVNPEYALEKMGFPTSDAQNVVRRLLFGNVSGSAITFSNDQIPAFPGRNSKFGMVEPVDNTSPGWVQNASAPDRHYSRLYDKYFRNYPNDDDMEGTHPYSAGTDAYAGTPNDLWDSMVFTLDGFGHWEYADNDLLQRTSKNPYGMDVYHPTPYDTPFTAGELEGLLRTTDVDMKSLPKRLRELLFVPTGSGLSDTTLADRGKYHLTTMSSDIPLPSRRIGGSPGIYSRLLTIMQGNTTAVENLLAILPEEVRNGERIDLNRLVQRANWVGGDHEEGLRERADLARGIYLLLMVMCYDQLYDTTNPYEEPSLAQETRLTPELKRQVMATRLAQFAVNLVDFMDPDNAMTPMVFDIDPFDTGRTITKIDFDDSNLQSRLTTHDPTCTRVPSPMSPTRLVWGLERPDVVMTETLATHDHKVAYYRDPSPTPTDDSEWKQIARPEGSLWIELYNTANANFGREEPTSNTINAVDLAAMDDDGNGNQPVWRIAISENTVRDADNNVARRLTETAEQPVTFSMQGNQVFVALGASATQETSSLLGPSDTGAGDDVRIDRLVYFGASNPHLTDPPHITDHVLWQDNVFWNQSGVAGTPLLLNPGQFRVIAPRASTNMGSLRSNVAGRYGDHTGIEQVSVAGNRVVVEATYGSDQVGLNVSMPVGNDYTTHYHPIPETVATNTKITGPGSTGITGADPAFDNNHSVCPLQNRTSSEAATIPMFSSVMLQRLADPMRAYNPVTNPYITVDWNMVDLTTFTGEDSGEASPPVFGWSPDATKNEAKLVSRQWGRTGLPTDLQGGGIFTNPWMRVLDTSENLDSSADSLDDEDTTLPAPPVGAVLQHRPTHTLGVVNEVSTGGQYINLAWRDAPLANPYEIMLVPASSPGRFGLEFVDTGTEQLELDPAGFVSPTNPIIVNTVGGSNRAVGSLGSGGRFGYDMPNQGNNSGMGHLLNFFHSGSFYVSGINTLSGKNASLNLGALLEHVQVPSRFMGTKLWLDPNGTDPYAVSLYREPGKINLNTVNEPTFMAMMGGRTLPAVGRDSTSTTEYKNFYNSRWIETATSSYFWPYRSYSGKNFVGVSPQTATDHDLPPSIYPDGGMLLRDAYLPASGAPYPLQPLLTPTGAGLTDNSEMLFNGLMRLSSMSTNRSNCFAVWITIGYFEVTKTTASDWPGYSQAKFEAIYPDGYVLGKEVGDDFGDVVRHRGFYLIDRTIPVGFQRGKDYNVLETVVTGRVIE